MKHMTLGLAVSYGADLLSVHGENVEYDRGISELIADMFAVHGTPHQERATEVMNMMRAIKPIEPPTSLPGTTR